MVDLGLVIAGVGFGCLLVAIGLRLVGRRKPGFDPLAGWGWAYVAALLMTVGGVILAVFG